MDIRSQRFENCLKSFIKSVKASSGKAPVEVYELNLRTEFTPELGKNAGPCACPFMPTEDEDQKSI